MLSLSAELNVAASPRNLSRFMMMSVLTLCVVAGFYTGRAIKPALTLPTAEQIKHVVEKAAAPKPAAPSAFAKESAMSPRELISRWEPIIAAAAKEYRLSADWIRAVMRMESGGRTMLGENQPIISSTGAMGLMQVMPDTYNDMRAAYRLGADPYNPRDNIFAGAAYLRALYRKYGYPAMFAAYNDGPGNLEDHLAGRRDLPDETRNYIDGIAGILGRPGATQGRVATSGGATLALTRPDGSTFAVPAGQVRSVRKPLPGEYADGVQAVITVGKQRQGVREDLATVARLTLQAPDASM